MGGARDLEGFEVGLVFTTKSVAAGQESMKAFTDTRSRCAFNEREHGKCPDTGGEVGSRCKLGHVAT